MFSAHHDSGRVRPYAEYKQTTVVKKTPLNTHKTTVKAGTTHSRNNNTYITSKDIRNK